MQFLTKIISSVWAQDKQYPCDYFYPWLIFPGFPYISFDVEHSAKFLTLLLNVHLHPTLVYLPIFLRNKCRIYCENSLINI